MNNNYYTRDYDKEFEILELKETDIVVFLGLNIRGDTYPIQTFKKEIEIDGIIYPIEDKKLYHQSAGIACHHLFLHGIIFPIKQELHIPFLQFHKEHDSLGAFNCSLNDLNEYADFLKTFNLTCQHSYRSLEESVYPIDVECAQQIINNILPKKLDDYLIFDSKISKLLGFLNRWNCFILANNSD